MERKPLSEIYNSFGVAIGFTLAGLVFAGAPVYLAASKGWSTVWYILAALFGLFGLLGALIEFGQLKGSEAASRFGVASMFVGISATFFILTHSNVIHGTSATFSKIISVIVAALGGLILGMGIGSWLHEKQIKPEKAPDKNEPSRNKIAERIISLVVALTGLATAIVSFLAAVNKK